jgi:hypothetical protein
MYLLGRSRLAVSIEPAFRRRVRGVTSARRFAPPCDASAHSFLCALAGSVVGA